MTLLLPSSNISASSSVCLLIVWLLIYKVTEESSMTRLDSSRRIKEIKWSETEKRRGRKWCGTKEVTNSTNLRDDRKLKCIQLFNMKWMTHPPGVRIWLCFFNSSFYLFVCCVEGCCCCFEIECASNIINVWNIYDSFLYVSSTRNPRQFFFLIHIFLFLFLFLL